MMSSVPILLCYIMMDCTTLCVMGRTLTIGSLVDQSCNPFLDEGWLLPEKDLKKSKEFLLELA